MSDTPAAVSRERAWALLTSYTTSDSLLKHALAVEAAVMSSGFVGFMLGTTANAMANMEAMVQRFGAAPRAFLVVPMVGAFFIDFANAILITLFLNVYR